MPVDAVLTRPYEAGPYGGSDINLIYAELRDTEGWWNDRRNFSLQEFVGLLVLHEASLEGAQIEVLLAEVVARHLWAGGVGGNAPYCPARPCVNGVFNYWARYSASAHRLVDAFVYGSKPIAEYIGPNLRSKLGNRVMVRAAMLGRLILHPPSSWREQDNNAPFGWGNSVAWDSTLAAQGVKRGFGPHEIVYRSGDGFLIFTPNQGHCHSVACWP